ncbi:crossover junction endodeoxyribonuclease RuvC [Helcobacillus massiliensis]|uniref:Crossover junction endodeoxyribonuclease RuvC n=1 Tax=Helcobacillus massiliensis TaxID=521392 RepID=A0A839R1S7_9MICO|nr:MULTISPECIES: crossover junction endodeoxyribonuclease RuvC [Helcobacillus]MBB3022576.1 crossover junction endodeoxyribonuclease RuvC [Helcobacillus massiliensis]MCG7426628.1 crossover junction endodeoxyribonuclease RuvC [Helcobacillus sp. ACRRO]MCT1557210.1 crossover junction endodeoxyribonuclease RuvC [Helcobacillus massiliensis]MCT2036940.1 crossover junction endodeoxyribonuclease RuvC [Helcobacillus massiliensis]MCT2332670.1 crossover junction endodeoxyribonuclease RuvC [Helcobacillus m
MRVLGIDPGLTRCGFGAVDGGASRSAVFVGAGVITSSSADTIDQRLLEIHTGLEQVIEEYAPDILAVERVFSQNNVGTVMGTAQVSGLAIVLAAQRGIPVEMHTPSEVKRAITDNGRADKKQIQAVVARLLGLAEAPKPADAADAVAIAITQLWRGRGTVRLDRTGAARTSAQAQWADAERRARRSREASTSHW